MRSYLNAQLGGPSKKLLDWISSFGFFGLRHGIRMSHEWDYIRMVFEAFKESEFAPLFLLPFEEDEIDTEEVLDFTETFAVHVADRGFDTDQVAIEFVNEPNVFSEYWKKYPEELGETFVKAIPRIRKWAKNVTILTPSVSNLGINEVEYAERMFTPIRAKADDYAVAFHRYPPRMSHKPHDGLPSRDAELARFIAAVTDPHEVPELWLTETGYPQVHSRPKGFPLCWLNERFRVSEREQADFAQMEYGYWKTRVNALCWYQLLDGPDLLGDESYGILTSDLKPKKIADRFLVINKTA